MHPYEWGKITDINLRNQSFIKITIVPHCNNSKSTENWRVIEGTMKEI